MNVKRDPPTEEKIFTTSQEKPVFNSQYRSPNVKYSSSTLQTAEETLMPVVQEEDIEIK